MRVIITGGGTAGHINPAIAIAKQIKMRHPNVDILYIGSKKGMEAKIVPEHGFAYEGIDVMGFLRSFSYKAVRHNIKAVIAAFKGSSEAKKIIHRFQPDLVVGTGGYISGPVILQAHKAGVKTAIHEQNAYPGITTKSLAPRVDLVLGAVQEVQERLDIKGQFAVVGNPVRDGFLFTDRENARKQLGVTGDTPVILSSGGSLGSQAVNRAVADLIAWHCKEQKIYHIHSKGIKLNSWVFDEQIANNKVCLQDYPLIDVRDFINDMPRCYAAADLIIGRTGAMTLSEIECAGKASVLIPSPNVTENHQYHNAMVLVKHGAAVLIEEKDLTGAALIQAVKDLIFDRAKLRQYGNAAQKLAVFDSPERIVSFLEQLLKT